MASSVTIRGVTYPTQKAAADALGVTAQTIRGARHRGTLDFVGCGHRPGPAYTKPITLGAHTFPSHAAAAEALGVRMEYLSGYLAVTAAMEKLNQKPQH